MVNIAPLPPAGPNDDDDSADNPAEESANQLAADIIAAAEAAAAEAAAAEAATAAGDQIPPENATAAARAISEFNGNRFVPPGQRQWEDSADGIVAAFLSLCYASTEQEFDRLWEQLRKEFPSQGGKSDSATRFKS